MAIDTRGFSLSTLPVYNPMDPRLFAVQYPDFGEIAERGIRGYATGMQIKGNKQQQELGALQIEDYKTKLDQQRDTIKKEREATDLFNNKVASLEGLADADAAGLQAEDKAFFDILKETKALGLAPTPQNYQAVAVSKAEREAAERLKQIEADAKVQIARLEKGLPYSGPLYSTPDTAALAYPEYEVVFDDKLKGYRPDKKKADTQVALGNEGIRYGYSPESWLALTDAQRNSIILLSRSASSQGLSDKEKTIYSELYPDATQGGGATNFVETPEDKIKQATERTKSFLINR